VRPEPHSIRILALDDLPRFREGIAAILATQPDMNLDGKHAMGTKLSWSSVLTARISR